MTINIYTSTGTQVPATPEQLAQVRADLGAASAADVQAAANAAAAAQATATSASGAAAAAQASATGAASAASAAQGTADAAAGAAQAAQTTATSAASAAASAQSTAASAASAAATAQQTADAAYVKPPTGIPAADMATAVQTSLAKADAALPGNADALADLLEGAATGAPADLARIQSSALAYGEENWDIIVLGDSYANLNIRPQYTFAEVEAISGVRFLYVTPDSAPVVGAVSEEFRVADGAVRWSSGGGAFGPWTVLQPGMNQVPNGAGAIAIIGSRPRQFPTADTTGSTTLANNVVDAWGAEGDFAVFNQRSGWVFNPVAVHGIGGDAAHDLQLRLAQALAATPEGVAYSRKPGWVYLTSFGANDVVGGGGSDADSITKLRRILDSLKTGGYRVIADTMPARLRATSTPLTVAEQEKFRAINRFYREYSAKNSAWLYLADSFSTTTLQSAKDISPASDLLVDAAHVSQKGAWLRSTALLRRMSAVIESARSRFRARMQTSENVHPAFGLTGTSGTLGTGCTGTVPTNLAVQRIGSGSDITCTASIVSAATLGVDDSDGNWLRLQINNPGATTQSICATRNASLGSWGVAVGNRVYGAHDVHVAASNLVDQISTVVNIKQSSTALVSMLSANRTVSFYYRAVSGVLVTPARQIPAGADNIDCLLRVYVRAGGSADVYMRLPALMLAD